MADISIPDRIPLRYLARSSKWRIAAAAMFLVGLAAFVLTLTRDSDQAWRAYVVNWLYFTAIPMGAIILTVASTVTKAKWNWSVKRVGMAFSAFLPISFLLFLPMLALGGSFFPWVGEMATDPILQNKSAYLNLPFLLSRGVIGLLALFGLALYFVYLAVRPDLGLSEGREEGDAGRIRWRERGSRGWRGQEEEEAWSQHRMARLAPALILVWVAVMSLIAFDWIMSLEPHWYSTLFGAWFFMGAFWGGIAATAFAAVLLRRGDPRWRTDIGAQQLHDLGKLSFAFCVFWAYLFWSQYIVIWYGKLPWEQLWIAERSGAPWARLSIALILLCFVIPFMGLIGRKPKMTPYLLATFTAIILAGLWIEKYLMVVPSIHDGHPTITIWEPLIGLMFLGPFLASVRWFLETFPAIQLWRPAPDREMVEMEVAPEGVGGRAGGVAAP